MPYKVSCLYRSFSPHPLSADKTPSDFSNEKSPGLYFERPEYCLSLPK